MKTRWLVVLVLGVIATAAFLPLVKTTEGATAVTGTTVTTTAWFGLRPVVVQQKSPLAKWCRSHGVPVAEDTVVFSRITRNVWGGVWTRNTGTPPASCDFTPAMQKIWLAHTAEPDMRRFVDAMATTDEPGRVRLVRATVGRLSAAP